MTTIAPTPAERERLEAFIKAVIAAVDTPALIRMVAGNLDYIALCRSVVVPDDPQGSRIADASNRLGIDPVRLWRRLQPVARSLGIAPDAENTPDYYGLLGIPPTADTAAVKSAYRRKAFQLHPDLSIEGVSDHQSFLDLQAAYATLRDPHLRSRYDAERTSRETPQPAGGNGWYEAPPKPVNQRRGIVQVVGILAVLVICAFGADLYYREKSVVDTGRPRPQAVTPPPDLQSSPPPAAVPAETGSTDPLQSITDTEPEPKLPEPIVGHSPVLEDRGGDVYSATHRWAAESQPPPPIPEPRLQVTLSAPVEMVPEPAPLDPDSPAARTAPLSPTPAAPAIEKPAVPPFSPRVRRISLYYAGKEDLTTAQSLAKHLQTTGHLPPLLEQVAYTGGGNLRYFHPSDRSLASDIAADARAFFKQSPSGDPGTFRLISMARSHPDVAPGLIEIWLPATGTNGGRAKGEPTRSSTAASPPSTAQLSDIDPAASLADARRRLEDTKRLNRFLDAYCRSYEAKDLAAFRRFFLPDATENGQPFDSLLPVYRRNLELIQQMEYRINVDRYEKAGADLDWRIEGTFHARCILTTSDVRETRGYIRLEVVPQAGSFRVKRLDYRLTAQ